MKIGEAATILAQMQRLASGGEKYAQVHLFGIKYADQLNGMTMSELSQLAERAGIPKSYGIEIRKGIKLAPFVRIK